MDLEQYIDRHKKVDVELKLATNRVNKVAAQQLLKALETINDNSLSIGETRERLGVIFTKMYTDDVYKSIVNFGEDSIIDNLKWESKIHDKIPTNYDMISISLFGKVLIEKNSLKNWLLRASYKDVEKLMRIIKTATIEDMSSKQLEKKIISHFKNPLNNVRRLMDAVAFSALFLVRDKVMKLNDVELMQWMSVLDKGTTPGCVLRDGLKYRVKNNEPYGHTVQWEMPGVYHWGCRSFMMPLDSK